MSKELLKKGDKVLYITLGLIRPAEVRDNDTIHKEIKIKVATERATWVKYANIKEI